MINANSEFSFIGVGMFRYEKYEKKSLFQNKTKAKTKDVKALLNSFQW